MLHSLTTSAILLAMLLHAAFGCHWHHGHAVDGERERGGEESSVADCSHHDHHGHHSGKTPAPEGPRSPLGDCEEDCTFLAFAPPASPALNVVWSGVNAIDFDADHRHWRMWNMSERNRNNLFYGDTSPTAQRPIMCIWLI